MGVCLKLPNHGSGVDPKIGSRSKIEPATAQKASSPQLFKKVTQI
jgi:hypothetical protein